MFELISTPAKYTCSNCTHVYIPEEQHQKIAMIRMKDRSKVDLVHSMFNRSALIQ